MSLAYRKRFSEQINERVLYDIDIHQDRVKCYPVHEYIIVTTSDKSTSKCHKCAGVHDSIWSSLQLFHCFYLSDRKFVALIIFFFFTRQNLHSRKMGCVSEVLLARTRPIGIRRAIFPGLYIFFVIYLFFKDKKVFRRIMLSS